MTPVQTFLLFGSLAASFFFLTDAALRLSGGGNPEKSPAADTAPLAVTKPMIKRVEDDADDTFVDRYFKNLLANADNPFSLTTLYLAVAATAVPLAAFFYFYLPYVHFAIGLAVSALLACGALIMLLKSRYQKRNARFEELFPDALELIVRSLRIGQPLNAAINAVASEMPDPVGKEFSFVALEIAYGKDLPDAVEGMLKRISIPDLRFFVVAIQIQHESGGNLAEVLEGLSKIIRGRSRLNRKVRALTVEGRFRPGFCQFFRFS